MEKRNKTFEVIHNIAENLRGSCQSLNEALEVFGLTEDDMTIADHDALDDIVFECAVCNWWCPVEEMTENGICDECDETGEDQ